MASASSALRSSRVSHYDRLVDPPLYGPVQAARMRCLVVLGDRRSAAPGRIAQSVCIRMRRTVVVLLALVLGSAAGLVASPAGAIPGEFLGGIVGGTLGYVFGYLSEPGRSPGQLPFSALGAVRGLVGSILGATAGVALGGSLQGVRGNIVIAGLLSTAGCMAGALVSLPVVSLLGAVFPEGWGEISWRVIQVSALSTPV